MLVDLHNVGVVAGAHLGYMGQSIVFEENKHKILDRGVKAAIPDASRATTSKGTFMVEGTSFAVAMNREMDLGSAAIYISTSTRKQHNGLIRWWQTSCIIYWRLRRSQRNLGFKLRLGAIDVQTAA